MGLNGSSALVTGGASGIGDPIYTLTEHAVVGYVRSAPTPAAQGIRVTALCPGSADTPLSAHAKEQFHGVPGPKGAGAPPAVTWEEHR